MVVASYRRRRSLPPGRQLPQLQKARYLRGRELLNVNVQWPLRADLLQRQFIVPCVLAIGDGLVDPTGMVKVIRQCLVDHDLHEAARKLQEVSIPDTCA